MKWLRVWKGGRRRRASEVTSRATGRAGGGAPVYQKLLSAALHQAFSTRYLAVGCYQVAPAGAALSPHVNILLQVTSRISTAIFALGISLDKQQLRRPLANTIGMRRWKNAATNVAQNYRRHLRKRYLYRVSFRFVSCHGLCLKSQS